MTAVFEWAKDHWYWLLGGILGLWILRKLVSSSSSAGANVTSSTPAGTSIVYGGTNANDAAVQVAQLNAQSQLAAAQIASGQAVTQAQIAEHATESTNAANVSITDLQGRYALAISNSNNAEASHVSDNATALGITQSNNASTVAIAQANYAYALGVNSNSTNLAALKDSNATQLAAYGIQASVANNQTNALKQIATTVSNNATAVQLSSIDAAHQLQAQQLGNQGAVINDTYQLVKSGSLNKGGEGGINQVAAWNAVINPSSAASGDAAAAAVGTTQAANNQVAGIISSLGTALTSVLSSKTAKQVFG